MFPAAGDGKRLIGSTAQLLENFVDQKVDAAAFADDAPTSLATRIVASMQFIHSRQRTQRQMIQLAIKANSI
jgi:hypothetical protein